MPTTRTVVPHFRTISGMDATTPPHLVEDVRWTMSRGFRSYYAKVVQLPLLNVFVGGTIESPGTQRVGRLVCLPTGVRDENLLVAVTDGGLYQINFGVASTKLMTETGGVVGGTFASPDVAEDQAEFFLMAATVYNSQLWYTSPITNLRYSDGTKVGEYTGNVPAGRYVENFFDHIVVGHSTFRGLKEPYTSRWSHLYDPGMWDPADDNEADFYDVSSWQRQETFAPGLTGMGKLRDMLVHYTESAIVGCRYVGLPKVMQFTPLWEGVGNSFYYGMVSEAGQQFFCDAINQDFYAFDGVNPPRSIGKPIIRFLLDHFPITGSLSQEFVGFSVPERKEIWWTFFSTPLAAYVTIIYNWLANEWTVGRFGPLHCIGGGGTRAKTISELTGTADDLGFVTANSLSSSGQQIPRIVATAGFALRRFDQPADLTTVLLYPEAPFLETKDFVVDVQEVGEIDRITIHADFGGNATGIDVYVSARMDIQEAITYQKVGTWTKNSTDGTVSFKPMSGRVFRYKFQWIALSNRVRDAVFYSFSDNLFSVKAER